VRDGLLRDLGLCLTAEDERDDGLASALAGIGAKKV
jgi:hypothetical protein